MNKQIISIYIQENFKDKLPTIKKIKTEQRRIYGAIYKYTDFLPKSTSFAERSYLLSQGLDRRPKCMKCDKLLKFKSYKTGYGKVCSKSCKG